MINLEHEIGRLDIGWLSTEKLMILFENNVFFDFFSPTQCTVSFNTSLNRVTR